MDKHNEAGDCLPINLERRENSASGTVASDSLSRDGAIALALRLRQYWHDRGYPAARFWAEPIDERFAKVGTYDLYKVVCNLVNGLPPRYRDDPG